MNTSVCAVYARLWRSIVGFVLVLSFFSLLPSVSWAQPDGDTTSTSVATQQSSPVRIAVVSADGKIVDSNGVRVKSGEKLTLNVVGIAADGTNLPLADGNLAFALTQTDGHTNAVFVDNNGNKLSSPMTVGASGNQVILVGVEAGTIYFDITRNVEEQDPLRAKIKIVVESIDSQEFSINNDPKSLIVEVGDTLSLSVQHPQVDASRQCSELLL